MIKKISSIGILIVIIIIGYLQKDVLLHIIREGGTTAILVSMLFVAICVFFPLIPFPVLAGIIGAVFGTSQGVFISLAGATFGTMAFFFLCRYGFRDVAQSRLRKYPKVKEYEELLNRNSFIAILTSRLIPLIPAPIVNIICGLSKVNWFNFLLASTIGKIPNILLLSYVGASFTNNKLLSFTMYGVYILVLGLINFVIIYRKMSKTN
ncbi:TVP38/TMEM64 family protein [Neobacillus sp. PS3-40]|uniref:TVP38/TMEM64 family protein n=1 Tax=Neobacillus sp. PS3-40 TaxID=3070679 RepID=UPI0027DF9C31|nr:TVP38/TMEM64 family protein [Neobacillus sp. PS3-40]WML44168.1 TVP38/TMEM64 family protein [Neobacillus sp. PS3-40]